MTCDRLMRCGVDLERYPSGFVGGEIRWLDGGSPRSGSVGPEGRRRPSNPAAPDQASENGDIPAERTPADRARPCSDDADMYEFAEWLKQRGEYERAVTEYLRLEFYYPASNYILMARKSTCHCYYLMESYGEAIACGESLLGQPIACRDSNDVLFSIGTSEFRAGRYVMARERFGSIGRGDQGGDDEIVEKAVLLECLSLAHMREWVSAERSFLGVSRGSRYELQAVHCARLCREACLLRRKNPTLAGFLAIAPGLGYLYDGYPRTALSAFVINGAFLWGTIEANRKGQHGLGVLLGVVGLGWYAGNLYGSVSSARRMNDKMEGDLLQKFDVGFRF